MFAIKQIINLVGLNDRWCNFLKCTLQVIVRANESKKITSYDHFELKHCEILITNVFIAITVKASWLQTPYIILHFFIPPVV